MMQGIKNTSNDTFRRLLGNGLSYWIPKYQRDYSWDSEQWSDLWYDLQQMIVENESHYMGYLVLQTEDDKSFQVIDGQQRLTTICILLLAIIKHLKSLGGSEEERAANARRAEAIHATFIGNIDVLTLTSENKIVLNRNNNHFYVTYLAPLQEFPKRGLNASEKLMKKAFETFYSLIGRQYTTAEELVRFEESVVDNLFFTVITVSDELNAFRVFETLNARGVQLSSSDLLKNYLFSVADSKKLGKNQLDVLDNMWSEIADILRDTNISDYLRIYWNSKHNLIRKNQLYRTIREAVKTPEQAFELLRDMRKTAEVYAALREPYDELWKGKPEITANLQLLKTFNVTQPIPLLLTGYTILSEEKFTTLLARIVVISFRYNVICGKNPNEQEAAYNKLALKICREHSYELEDIKTGIYVKDNEFEQTFANKEFTYNTRNNKVAKYILEKLEKFDHAVSFNEEDVTLEHILPDSPDPAVWTSWADDKVSHYRYRLGNMTLLEHTVNRELGNAGFQDKKEAYKRSGIPMTRQIGESESEDWTEENIEKRQHRMAAKAKGIWKL